MPLLWLSLALIVGVVLSAALGLSLPAWLWLAGLSLALLLLLPLSRFVAARAPRWSRNLSNLIPAHIRGFVVRVLISPPGRISPPPLRLLMLSLLVAFLGAVRYQAALPQVTPDFIAWYNGGEAEMVVVGVVDAFPDVRDGYTNLRVRVERIRPEETIFHEQVHGLLLARVPLERAWHYGDRVVLRGTVETPPEAETFSYRDYLARQDIYSYMPHPSAALLEAGQGNPLKAALYSFRQRALDTVYQLWPDPEASLLAGILLGVESGIPAEVKQAFNDTGTSHVIAISGFNITIVSALFAVLFSRWLGPWRGAAVTALGVAVYTFIVGGDAAVVRAAVMGGLTLLARQIGRRQFGLNSLAFTAALMTLLNPQVLWDVGFQLSFAATLGLVLYAEPLSQAFVNLASRRLPPATVKRLVGPVGEYFLFTLAAQVTTLPVVIYHFQRLSLTSLPANVAILPAQPPVMILGGLAVLLALVFYPLGQLIAYLSWPFVVYTIRMVEWFAQYRAGVLVLGQLSLYVVVAFYLLLFGLTFGWNWLKSRLPVLRPALATATLGLAVVLVWQAALNAPDGLLHLTILDVGDGDALLIQTPEGRFVLVDGGPSLTRLSDALGRRLPLFHRQLDFLIVGAVGEDQLRALPRTIERFPPAGVLWAGLTHGTWQARQLQESFTEASIPVTLAEAGHIVDLGQGAQIEVITTGARGAILLLRWDQFRGLLPLGGDFADLETLDMGREIGPVSALLLADSGYAPLNPPQWIANLHPQVVLLSVAADNYEGLPSKETLEALQSYVLLRTDQHGWIHLSTDGQQMWLEAKHNSK